MITLQETYSLGCATNNISCPIWVYNYLSTSVSNGGTVNDTSHGPNSTSNNGYWTMSALSSNANCAWRVTRGGIVYYDYYVYSTSYGARTVV